MPAGKSYRIKSGVLTRNHLRPSDCNVRQTAAGRQPRPVPLQNIATGLTCGFRDWFYAARWYSLITPPRIFRRCTGAIGTTTGPS